MQIQDLKINGVKNPVGFHLDRIICSWKVTDTSSRKQEKVEIQVSLDEDFEDSSLVQQMLQEKAGRKVELFVPARGDNRKLVEMARNNASQRLAANKPYSNRDVAALDELARLLGLKNPPKYIEAYDISNIGDRKSVV